METYNVGSTCGNWSWYSDHSSVIVISKLRKLRLKHLINIIDCLGATSIVKIGEVRLSDEIGGGRDFEKTELFNY